MSSWHTCHPTGCMGCLDDANALRAELLKYQTHLTKSEEKLVTVRAELADERFQNATAGQRERAEAAEARVAELEAALSGMLSRDSFGCSCDEPALGVCRWHALTARAAALVKGGGR